MSAIGSLIVGIVGLAVSGTGTAMSFAQAGRAKRAREDAEADAKKAMDRARKRLEVNYYEELAIRKEPYELEREALLVQGAQAIAAGQESERGGAATAGRVQMAQNQAQRQVAAAMGQEAQRLEELVAGEEARLRDVNVQLDLEESAGAQIAAADAAKAQQQAIAAGIQGLGSTVSQAGQLAPLYAKSASVRQEGKTQRQLTRTQRQNQMKAADVTKLDRLNPFNTEYQKAVKSGAINPLTQQAYQQKIAGILVDPNLMGPPAPNQMDLAGQLNQMGGITDLTSGQTVDVTPDMIKGLGTMSEAGFDSFMGRLSPEQIKMIREQLGL